MDNIDLSKYQTFVFDCDGVVLDSNKIKTQAFYDVASFYGYEAAQELKDYHVQNGGISRYAKFEYFLTNILGKELCQNELNTLLERFAEQVKTALLRCDIAEGLNELRNCTKNSKWLIVSGGDQAELRDVFIQRGLAQYFDGGIFGSPDTKDDILSREIINQVISKPCLYLGDSKYDYYAANKSGLDFVFISQWTDVEDWQCWVNDFDLTSRQSLKVLC